MWWSDMLGGGDVDLLFTFILLIRLNRGNPGAETIYLVSIEQKK